MTAGEFAVALIRQLRGTRHRGMIVVAGDRRHNLQIADCLIEPPQATWVSNLEDFPHQALSLREVGSLLGREVPHLVFDGQNDFDADAFGIASGCVKAGGLLVLLAPDRQAWPSLSLSQQRLMRLADAEQDIYLIEPNQIPMLRTNDAITEAITATDGKSAATADQQRAVDAVLHVIQGQRKRPAILVSDRGRGKSAALGIAAGLLLSGDAGNRVDRIIVSGRGRSASTALFHHAGLVSATKKLAPQWIGMEQLLATKPDCDLLLIDEAASIPLGSLDTLLGHYPRIAMATTVHGYEGTGRGFVIRFADILKRKTRGARWLNLHQPVRWAENDPLENATNKLLVLDAELPPIDDVDSRDRKTCVVEVDRSMLAADEQLLRQIFSLLVLAHYRTKPSDLCQLLDNPALGIFLLRLGDAPGGVALVVREGGLDSSLSHQIFYGRRRPPGHVLPEIFAGQLGQPDAATATAARIMRIVVHPDWQRRGLGSKLLAATMVRMADSVDLIGSHFAALPGLIPFWRRQQLQPVRVGLGRSAHSGGHSVVMVRPCSSVGHQIIEQAISAFSDNFVGRLATSLRQLDPTVVSEIIAGHPGFSKSPDARLLQQSISYFLGSCAAESIPAALTTVAQYGLCHQALRRPNLWIEWIMQARSWQQCSSLDGSDGLGQANRLLREDLGQLLHSHFGAQLRDFRDGHSL